MGELIFDVYRSGQIGEVPVCTDCGKCGKNVSKEQPLLPITFSAKKKPDQTETEIQKVEKKKNVNPPVVKKHAEILLPPHLRRVCEGCDD